MHVTTNQRSVRDIQEIKREESKHNPTESHRNTKEESKRVRKERGELHNSKKTVKWQYLHTINTYLNVNKQNTSVKRHNAAEWIKKKTRLIHMLPTKEPFQMERHTQTENKGMEKDIS